MKVRLWPGEGLKACLFDLGGTLDADGIAWQDQFYEIYADRGVRVDREAFRQAFHRSDDDLVASGDLQGVGVRGTIEAQVSGVFDALGIDREEAAREQIVTEFERRTRAQIQRNRPLLLALKERYRLGIVSNFYGNLSLYCEELGIRDLFEVLVDSNRVGVTKPDPQIFRCALDALGADPSEAVFVGDNVFRDMEGARELGMPHVWLQGPYETDRMPCCPEDPVIRSLPELRPLLLEPAGGTPRPGEPRAEERDAAPRDGEQTGESRT